MAPIGIIGGSGLEELIAGAESAKIATPFGAPSADVEIGEHQGVKIAFLARHGKAHAIPPHRVNYRANIWALKEVGVERVIGISAVGSLKEDYQPGELVLPDQYIDFTKKRDYTFYNGGKTIHISTADPFCPELHSLFFKTAKEVDLKMHSRGTYICIEGPRFSTRAESRMFRAYADIIGMTLVPEVQLARELEMCYVCVAMVTDYDVWAEKPVDVADVIKTMGTNIANIKKLLAKTLPEINPTRNCPCKTALKDAAV